MSFLYKSPHRIYIVYRKFVGFVRVTTGNNNASTGTKKFVWAIINQVSIANASKLGILPPPPPSLFPPDSPLLTSANAGVCGGLCAYIMRHSTQNIRPIIYNPNLITECLESRVRFNKAVNYSTGK